MDPYYQDTAVTLYHADCREVLSELGQFDLLLTDPPYGIGGRMQGGTWGAKSKYTDFRRWDVAPDRELLSALIGKVSAAVIWGGNYFQLPPSRCWLVWDKQNAVDTMSDCELAWTNMDAPTKRLSLPVGRHEFDHPTQKPMKLFAWTLTRVPMAKTILDPYAGTGTTLRVAKDHSLQAVGIEINERYCEIAANRCAQEVLI